MINSKGTERGGPRRNSGTKKKKGEPFRIIESSETAAQIAAQKKAPDWMRRKQLDGRAKLRAQDIMHRIDAWLIERGVRQHVPDHLIEMYSMALARYIQTEEEISKAGFLAKHPTTGAPMTSPYVTMSLEFSKQVQANWWQIYTTIKEATANEEKPAELNAPTNSLIDLLAAKRNA